MEHKAGFVFQNIIGNPNVGKSTLMNVLIGKKLSIITHKAQTTRHRILGILNEDNYQIVFSDTPGIINVCILQTSRKHDEFCTYCISGQDGYLHGRSGRKRIKRRKTF